MTSATAIVVTTTDKDSQPSEEKSSEEIIRKYKILDEKCEEALKRIKKRRKINSK